MQWCIILAATSLITPAHQYIYEDLSIQDPFQPLTFRSVLIAVHHDNVTLERWQMRLDIEHHLSARSRAQSPQATQELAFKRSTMTMAGWWYVYTVWECQTPHFVSALRCPLR